MSVAKDQQEAQYAQLLNSDPEIRRILTAFAAMPDYGASALFNQEPAATLVKQYNARVAQLGIDVKQWLPTRHFDGPTPTITVDHQNWVERHPNEVGALAVGGMFAAPLLAPSLVGLGGVSAPAAAGGAATAPTVAGATAPAAADAGASTAGLFSETAAGPATAKTVSAAEKFFNNPITKAAIAGGTAVVGKVLDYKAQSNAADQAQAAADKALALQQEAAAEAKRLADRQYADKAPYRNVGGQAISTLGALMGLPSGPAPATLASQTSGGPSQQQSGPPVVGPNPAPSGESFTPDEAMLARQRVQGGAGGAAIQQLPPTLGSVNAPTVRVKAPNQNIYFVPRERVQEALNQGGQVVQ